VGATVGGTLVAGAVVAGLVGGATVMVPPAIVVVLPATVVEAPEAVDVPPDVVLSVQAETTVASTSAAATVCVRMRFMMNSSRSLLEEKVLHSSLHFSEMLSRLAKGLP